MPVRTNAVRSRLIGEARKELKQAAGSNEIVSKTEQKKLSKDVSAAVNKVRAQKSRVTVDDAVDAYAAKVSSVLKAVDTRGKGVLSEAEANKISDRTLRSKVLDIRAALLAGTTDDIINPPTDDGGDTSATGVTSAALLRGMAASMDPASNVFCESGDIGVNVSMWKVPGSTLDEVLANAPEDPAAPWTNGESHVVLSPTGTVAETIAAFTSYSKEVMENERDDVPDIIENFVNSVETQFGALSEVHLAKGQDFGARYLVGKTDDGYVAIAVQPYGHY